MKPWLDLEARFRVLAPALRECRIEVQWGMGKECWRLTSGIEQSAVTEFEMLAVSAGQLLERALRKETGEEATLKQTVDPKIRWYTALKFYSPLFELDSHEEELKPDGSSGGFMFTGHVRKIADASADLCLAFQQSHPISAPRTGALWRWGGYFKTILLAAIGAGAATLILKAVFQ